MQLELADNYTLQDEFSLSDAYTLAADYGEDSGDLYFFVPNELGITWGLFDSPDIEGGKYVREDLFDVMGEEDYENLLAILEPYQPSMSFLGFGKKARARRQERKATRQQNKLDRIAARGGARAVARSGGGGIGGMIKDITGALTGGSGGGGGGGFMPQGQTVQAPKKAALPLPLIIVGVMVVGGGIYMATKKK